MQNKMPSEASDYTRQNTRRRIWRRFVRVMACIVVFCTTYALILPAITMEKQCTLEEHTHTQSCYVQLTSKQVRRLVCTYESLGVHTHHGGCYGADGSLICTMADYVVHVHDDSCLDETGALVCQLPEINTVIYSGANYQTQTNGELHTHDDTCYEIRRGDLICGLEETEGHTHGDACYVPGELLCTLEQTQGHTHGEGCTETVLVCDAETEPHIHDDTTCYQQLVCEIPESEEHTHTDACSGKVLICDLTEQPHTHGDGCYETHVICEIPETEGHTHTEECYESLLACEMNEEEPHVHTDSCYEQIPELICTLEEGASEEETEEEEPVPVPTATVHVHDDSCFVTEEVLLDDMETLTCTLTGDHVHGPMCYGTWALVCEKEEHTHDLYCLMDPEADLETEAMWIASFSGAELTEVWAEDVISIARTQLGYAESSRNYVVLDDGVTTKGYTRYGAWYGDPYGDWCAMFASFCLHYAGVEEIPLESSCPDWIEALTEEAMYCAAADHTPRPGDLVFFDWEGDGLSDHVGIVERITADSSGKSLVKTIEGNSGNRVAQKEYELDDETILGYFVLPLKPEEQPAEVEAVEALIEALPTYDEIVAKLDAFYEADDTEGEEAYLTEVYAQVEEAYRAYMALDESLREQVRNADKLMELEFIWSRITLEETFNADARDDDITVVTGGGIKFGLFDYINDKINKTSDGTAWRPISRYFNFRDSRSDYGPEAAEHNTDHTINAEHDQDGYTIHHATVERKLVNGMPVLDLTRNANGSLRTDPGLSQAERSLAYLFSSGDYAVNAYNPANTILQKNGNHYWYDSKNNAVDYDVNNNLFRLRNYAEINEVTSAFAGYSDFLPFTYTNGKVSGTNATTDVDYHVAYKDVNYWFGMTMDVKFFQTKNGQIDGGDMIFNFSGDDDVWVFIDDVLVLDLGGTHGTVNGSINFATGEVKQYLSWSGAAESNTSGENPTSFPTTIRACFDAAGVTPNGGWNEDGTTLADYTEHTLKFFYMERGAAVANCKLDFRLPTLPDKSLTVTKDLVIDGNAEVRNFLEDTLVYRFRVMKADAEGNPTDEFFVKPGMTYTILTGGASAGTGTVAADGTFSLRPGQSAQFTDMLVKGGGAVEYVVQEIIPENLAGQYGGIEYEVSGAPGSVESESGEMETFLTYSTGKLSAESTQTVVYRNRVDTANLSILKLTKAAASGAEFDSGRTFDIQVKLGGELLPVGTQYQIDGTDEIRTVETAGIVKLKIGETATILEGIISGTEFEITELGAENGGFTPAYTGILTHKDGTVTDVACTANGASGEFTLNSAAHVTVTNANYDFSGQIPIYKIAVDNTANATFRFLVEGGTWENGVWNTIDSIPGAEITVSDAAEHETALTIGYKAGTSGTFFYRITEQRGSGPYIYDTSFYIVEVEVTAEGTDGRGTAKVKNIWKNGTELTGKVLFNNRMTTNLVVIKTVPGTNYSGTFGFTAEVTLNGEPVQLPQPLADAPYTVEGNVAHFELGDNGAVSISGIPFGSVVTVKEVRHDGFIAHYQVSGVDAEAVLGDTAQIIFTKEAMRVEFINQMSFELPETGGAGTTSYTMGGLLLILAAAILLYIQYHQRRKEARTSF